ncbi:DUF4188 domain-containing protein [Pontibacillus yanchengensis]|uniref:Transcriptional regulator n=1 Tax=Pontibacillus yanchengensis Y32 TaxID=1385514 RepID=A0A0A2TD06_9BACI|nr:DUF4188 domain-containing protein [Pontibacillus yanchengensis]KGP73727.1 transcriptional regulator [Pontibacillus yanchengensis Y32]
MGKVFSGRHTVDGEQHFTVFLIGMRVNKWWKIHKWLPVFLAMPPMIKELMVNKDLGCLSLENFFGLRTTLMVQYWRSEEELLAYAKGEKHLQAWKNFNKKVGNNDSVGIFHETYNIREHEYETIYGNMPVMGLAKAIGSSPVTSSNNSARKRLGQKIKGQR